MPSVNWPRLALRAVRIFTACCRFFASRQLVQKGREQAYAAQKEATKDVVEKAAAAGDAAVADYRAHGVRDDDPNLRD